MLILDKRKDFYDYLAHIYGADDRVVYNRGSVLETHKIRVSENLVGILRDVQSMNGWRSAVGCHYFHFLVVLNKIFLIEKNPESTTHYPESYRLVDLQNIHNIFGGSVWHGSKYREFMETGYYENDELATLTKKPVFHFRASFGRDDKRIIQFVPTVPILQDIVGVSKHFTPIELYQGIEQFLGQEMESMPATNTPNNVKIQAAGFDLKQSFRHRK